jgi:hypothetical protein
MTILDGGKKRRDQNNVEHSVRAGALICAR